MPTPTDWYTSLQQGGASVLPPPRGRRGGGGGGGGGRGSQFNDFQSKQRSLRHAIAEEELRQLKTRGASDRWDFAARRRTPTQTGQTSWQRGPRGPARGRQEGADMTRAAGAAKALTGLNIRLPSAKRDLGTWLNYIGAGRAHEGLMQTGRLLGQGGSGGGGGGGGVTGRETPSRFLFGGVRPGSRAGGGYGASRINEGLLGAATGPGPEPGRVYTEEDFLPTREKGGTIPKTGPYELHEGEIVVSADQVDRPLLAALKADKLNKMYSGQMDGKGTGPGPPTAKSMVKDEFRGGTLGSYQGGTMRSILDALMEDQEPKSEAEQLAKDEAWADLGRWAATPSEGQPKPSESGPESGFFDLPGFEPWKGLPSSAREAGERIREGMPDFGGMAEDIGGFWGGLTGAPGTPEPETALAGQNIEKPEQLGVESPAGVLDQGAPPEPSRPSSAAAYDVPLQEGVSAEDQLFNPQSQKWRDNQHSKFMAAMNEQKADRLDDFLAGNAGSMEPSQHAELSKQSKQLRQSVDTYEKRVEVRRSVEETLFQKAQEAILNYEGVVDKAKVQAKATGDRWNRRDQQAEYRDLKRNLFDLQDAFGQGKYDDFDGIMDLMASLQQDITLHDTGKKISKERAKLLLQHDMEDDFTQEDLEFAWQELDALEQ